MGHPWKPVTLSTKKLTFVVASEVGRRRRRQERHDLVERLDADVGNFCRRRQRQRRQRRQHVESRAEDFVAKNSAATSALSLMQKIRALLVEF